MNPTQFLACLLAVVLFPAITEGRRYRMWSYGELRDEADFIVIARPTAIKETDERGVLPGIARVGEDGKQNDIIGAGVETTFVVMTVLKGEAKSKQIVLHHYREAETATLFADGPALISFTPKQKTYLMFLKREADGRYCAVSGQTDPDQAIMEIESRPVVEFDPIGKSPTGGEK